MWRINEVVALDGEAYRILHSEEGVIYWIRILDEKVMPEAVTSLELSLWVDDERLKRIKDPFVFLQSIEVKPDTVQAKKRDKSFKLIESIVADSKVFDRSVRGQRINEVAEKGLSTKASIYKLLKRFWQRGQMQNALLPDYRNSGAPGKLRVSEKYEKSGSKKHYGSGQGSKVDENIQRLFSIIIDRYLLRRPPLSQSEAYSRFVQLFLEHNPDMPVEEIPTKRQFTYFYKKHYSVQEIKKRQNSIANYLKDLRPLKSTATAGAPGGPGMRYEIDATIADIYLVSEEDRSQIIGRPTIYFVIDVYSRMVVGFYVGFDDPSYTVAMQSLVNAVGDKPSFCQKLGVDIEPEEWPCEGLPEIILADRGEMLSHQVEALIKNFSVRIENAPPFRGDAKGIVESHFRTVPAQFKPYTPGIVQGARIKKHGEKDYRLEANLTLKEFSQIILHTVLYRNNYRTIERYDRDEGMPPEVPSIPIEIWKWGLQHKSGVLRAVDVDRFRITLLPRKKVGISEYGISLWGLYFTSHEILGEGWLHRGKGHKRPQTLEAAFDPGSADVIYLFPDGDKGTFWRCTLTDRSRRFRGMSFWEVWDIQFEEKNHEADYKASALAKKNELLEKIDQILQKAQSQEPEVVDSDRQRVKAIKDNKKAAKHDERKQRAQSNNSIAKQPEPAKVTPIKKEPQDDYSFPTYVSGLFEDKRDSEEDD